MIKPVELTDERKKLIQSYYKESVDFNSVFLFAFNAANNDVDSNNEKFSLKALKSISELLIGKCGFATYDDGGYSLNKLSRVIETDVRIDAGIPTITGDPYVYVYAIAYIVNNEKTKDICEGIFDGELTEFSIGASCTERYEQGDYTVIDDVIDVYEFSLICPIKTKQYHSKLIDTGKLLDEIEKYDYELVSTIGTRDRGMFTTGIKNIINKLSAEPTKFGMKDVIDKYFSDYKILDQSMREFMNNPDNMRKVADLISDMWRQAQTEV